MKTMGHQAGIGGPWHDESYKGGDVEPSGGGAVEQVDDFDVLFPVLFRRAYQVAFHMLGSRVDAEDLAQEATARALARWRTVSFRQPEAWVAVVATHLALDVERRRRRRWHLLFSRDPSADGDALAMVRMALCDGLRSLPVRQREVVILRYVMDLSQEEVASELGISAGAVKQHAARGCAHLRQWFEANWEGGRDDISALG